MKKKTEMALSFWKASFEHKLVAQESLRQRGKMKQGLRVVEAAATATATATGVKTF